YPPFSRRPRICRRPRRLPRHVRRSIRERPKGLPRHRIPTTAAGWSRHSRFRYRRCGRRHTELAARDPVVSRSRISTCRYRHSGLAEGLVQREPVALDHPALGTVSSDRSSRAGHPATIVLAGTSRVTTLPAPIRAPSPIVTFARIVAPEPMEAPCLTSVGSTRQSLSVCSPPCGLVARGYESLMNITPWPMNTLSSMVTPSQMNVWLEILQFLPTLAFFWISTKAPILVSSPTSQPYRLMNFDSLTPRPSFISRVMQSYSCLA